MKDHLKTKKQLIDELGALRRSIARMGSEEPLKLITDQIPGLLAYVNKDQHYVYVNQAYANWYGLSKEEIIGKKVKDVLNEESYPRAIKHIRSVLQGKEVTYENVAFKNGNLRTVKTRYIPHFNKQGKVIAFLAMVEDITDQKQAKEALRESEERYRAIFERAADSIVLIDPETGTIIEFNERAHKTLGYSRKEFDKIRISDFEIIENNKEVMKHLRKVIDEGPVTFETKHKTKKGEIRDILISASTISIGGRCLIQGIWRDITERKRIEEALVYRSEFERRITAVSSLLVNLPPDKIDDGIIQAIQSIGEFSNVDRGYVFLFNDNETRMNNTHEWCAQGIKPQINRLQDIPVNQYLWSIKKIRKSKTIHIPNIADLPPEADPEKKEFQKEKIQSLIMVPTVCAGHVVGFLGFDSVRIQKRWPEDIIGLLRIIGEIIANALERKKTEEALRESEKKYRELVELLPQTIFEIDLKGNFVFVNEYGLKIFGYTKKDLRQGIHIKQLFPPNEYKKVVETMQRILKDATGSGNEYVALKKDGSEIHVMAFSKPLFYEGKHKGWLGTVIDITERIQAVKAIQESEEKFRTLAEQSPNMIFINKDRKIVYANKKCEEITGYTREELYSPYFDFINLIVPEHHNLIRVHYKQHMQDSEVEPYEYVILSKNGERIDAIISTKLIDYEGGKAILGIVTDITERKRMEEALRRSQTRLELTLDSVGIGLWDHEIKTGRVIRSRHWSEMLGYQPDEIQENVEVWKELIHPEDFPLVEETTKQHETGKIPFIKVEHRLKTKDNHWKWILNWGKIIEYDENGKPVRALGTHIDITDRKQAEEEIKRANREWQNIFQAVGHPMVILDPNFTILAANAAVLKKTGKSEKQLLGKKCYHVFHGVDRNKPEGCCPLQAFVQYGSSETSEMEMQTFGGTYLVSCTPVLSDAGKLEKIIHTATDITELKQAEKAMIESEKQFRSIFENAVMGFYRTTPDGQIVIANPALIRMLGYSSFEEISKRNLEKDGYEPGYSRAKFKEQIEKKGQIVGYESAWIKQDGTPLYVSESARAVFDDHGNVRYYEGTIEDITKRKRAEKLIQQSLEEKEALLKEIHHRVKNNLQVIISLLNLQAGQVQDNSVAQAFKESNRRIRSMALVHEKLYQSDNFSTINFKEYVEGMIQELFTAYKVTDKVKLKLDIDDAPQGISEAIPCGLILNELISNALKYAFPEGREGWIRVDFHKMENGEYELIVKDNGIGISQTIDFNKTRSLGLLLVKILTDQIDGTVDMMRQNGTIFKIRFRGQE